MPKILTKRVLKKILIDNQTTSLIAMIFVFFLVCHVPLRDKYSDFQYPSLGTPSISFASPHKTQINLPNILNESDAKTYKAIFTLQKTENWVAANKMKKKLKNRILIGHVEAQKLLHLYYNPTRKELRSWISKYSDHPQAYKIYKLAKKIDPTFKSLSKTLKNDYLSGYGDGSGLTRSVEHSLGKKYWGTRSEAYSAWKRIYYHIRRGRITYTKNNYTKSEKYSQIFTPLELDMVKLSLAEGYFAYNKDKEALATAEEAIKRSGDNIPNLYRVAGIASWRLGHWNQAAEYLNKLSTARGVSSWDKSLGGFWAYRAYRKIGKTTQANDALRKAHEYPRTFYGMLSAIALGKPTFVEGNKTTSPTTRVRSAFNTKGVKRALALVQIQDNIGAEKELRKMYPKSSLAVKKQLLSLANAFNIPGLTIRMASMISREKAGTYDDSLYPIPAWTPEDGFTLNPALVYAYVRHESGFNPYAKSHVGARGLMQLMPKTASYIAKKRKYKITSSLLFIPEKNLTVGQDYLEYLLSRRKIKGNLFYMAAAYNAGPNTLSRWVKKVKHDNDPLLFIESIPSRETRDFIERIMSNYWIYRERLGYETPSINAILEGEWPIYELEKKKKGKTHKVARLLEGACHAGSIS